MRYEDEIDRSKHRQSRGRETVKRSGNRNPAPNQRKELTLITDSFKHDGRRPEKRKGSIYERPEQASSRKKTSRQEEKNRNRKPSKGTSGSAYRASAKKKVKKRRRRILSAVAAFLFLLVGTAFAGYTYLDIKWKGLTQRDENWNPDELINLDISEEKQEQMQGYWTIAVFGLDSRNGSVGKGNNSDVNMICNLNFETGEINLVSVYRDTYLNVNDKNSYNKMNSAFLQGGPTQAVKTLNKNLDLEIDDYAVFNWKAVAEAINILGGVDIEITKKEFYYINAFITETVKGTGIPSKQLKSPGMNHLDGVQAVAYGRLRLMDTDYERTERQRKVISLAFEKAKKADWATINNVIQTLLVTEKDVDTSIELNDIIKMGRGLTKLHLGESSGFPTERREGRMGNKGDCVIPDTLESNVTELHRFLFGDENYQPSSQVKNISSKIEAEYSGRGSGKKKNPEKTTEAPKVTQPSTTKHQSGMESSSYEETGGSHEYPWATEDGGAVGPGKPTNPNWPGNGSGSHGSSKPNGESGGPETPWPGGGSAGDRESSEAGTEIGTYPFGNGNTGLEGSSSSPYPGSGGAGNGIPRPGGGGSQNENQGPVYPGSGSSNGSIPGQNTDTGVILGPGTGN